MDKFEKKNFGIPVTILVVFAYLIGYALTRNLSGTLLVAVLFAAAVFTFQFDDRVKNAVKNSYVIAIISELVYLILQVIESLISLISGGRFVTSFSSLDDIFSYGFGQTSINFLYTLLEFLVNAAVIVIFAICIIMSLTGKDDKIGIASNILGEGPKKPHNPNPTYNPYGNNPNYNQPNFNQGYNQPNYNQPNFNQTNNTQPNYNQSNYNQQNNTQPNNNQPVYSQQIYSQPGDNQSNLNQSPVPPVAPSNQASKDSQANVNQALVCPNCGRVNNSEAIFCGSCGTKLK